MAKTKIATHTAVALEKDAHAMMLVLAAVDGKHMKTWISDVIRDLYFQRVGDVAPANVRIETRRVAVVDAKVQQ